MHVVLSYAPERIRYERRERGKWVIREAETEKERERERDRERETDRGREGATDRCRYMPRVRSIIRYSQLLLM